MCRLRVTGTLLTSDRTVPTNSCPDGINVMPRVPMIIGASMANLPVSPVSNEYVDVGNGRESADWNDAGRAFRPGGRIRAGGGFAGAAREIRPQWNRRHVCRVSAASSPTGQGTNMNLLAPAQFFRPSSSVPLALPEAAKALEDAWQRRRQELGGWQPSNGWLIEPSSAFKRSPSIR